MCDDSSDYPQWVGGDARPLYFEGRISDVIWPYMLTSGLGDMKVDFMTVTSTYWDESFLWHVSHIPPGCPSATFSRSTPGADHVY